MDPTLTQQTLWTVWVHFRVGFYRSASSVRVFDSERDADVIAGQYPVGLEISQSDQPFPVDFATTYSEGFKSPDLFFAAGGDPNFSHIYECLSAAGVINETSFRPSQKVLDWAGPDRVSWAKMMDPENWSCLIEMEYCTHHFPSSSLAYMAAQFQLNYYILQDDYSAGYIMREIEMALGGIEAIAEKTLAARKSAGEAGRRASQTAKRTRLSCFMDEIEKLGDLVGRMAEQVILDQAFKNSVEQDAALWRQGRGQQAEYETALRSEPEYRTRYYRVFGRTA